MPTLRVLPGCLHCLQHAAAGAAPAEPGSGSRPGSKPPSAAAATRTAAPAAIKEQALPGAAPEAGQAPPQAAPLSQHGGLAAFFVEAGAHVGNARSCRVWCCGNAAIALACTCLPTVLQCT